MINLDILPSIRTAVCAVGYLAVTLEDYLKNPYERDHFRVKGTGFLIRENTVITNRHVIQAIRNDLIDRRIPDDRRITQFVFPGEGAGWHTSFCGVEFASTVDDKWLDVGFMDITRQPNPAFAQCQPLTINDDPEGIFMGQKVAILGYPEGNDLFINRSFDSQLIYRFGPVLQQGYISAVAPYDKPPHSRILADIRTFGGMSGSPVFQAETGIVLGLHEDSNKETTAFSLPLLKLELDEWLEKHDALRASLTVSE